MEEKERLKEDMMKMRIGESGMGGICGKEAKRGENTGKDLKVEEAEERK